MSDTQPSADEAAAGHGDAEAAAPEALAPQPAPSRTRLGPRDVVALIVESGGLLAQLILLTLGGFFISTEDEDAAILALIGWCLVGTLYVFVTVVWMNIEVRGAEAGSRPIRWILTHPLARVLSTVGTFIASFVGLWCAIELIFNPDWHDGIDIFAVWAMLLAWALFHWGFARIYFARFYRQTDAPPLEFPKTPSPQLADFVYFSFTNGTNFSVSDVVVLDRRMRWTVIWHTTISFFFNALIIVLSINTITSGGFGGEVTVP
ncbi:DUF1345 domain-containing protein [Agromyces aerolatus]|uniref:DUF1345 domain-containing protein n=1 Tax=Agromyces sp. LY-1074 TaxID=3074080 RepID=UPI002859D7CB|nr:MULTISPECIES: DUF1345 domain-containing protein [unclassified Agromyces]MDR5699581.1 DUF1345 domain-containing protein [Agromyces sp. LY-1074]MDR5705877.1 DUF1345 domain-containing protein [Agromyces sp. LY-1358]